MSNSLLMIPGPVEIAPDVLNAYAIKPPSHLSDETIEAFGQSLEYMRLIWCAEHDAQPLVVSGSGTLAMDIAVCNIIDPGQSVLVVHTGYFSERMAKMLRRRGAIVHTLAAPLGQVPDHAKVCTFLDTHAEISAIYATHVDTSTGVRIDAKTLSQEAQKRNILSIFDGVCATAAETFLMKEWGADVYLTGSQKALGLPPGLALLVMSARAIRARDMLRTPPPMSLDVHSWIPIMRAYEERRPSYFSTPATHMIHALHVALKTIINAHLSGFDSGIDARIAQHERAARAMRAAWSSMGLKLLPASETIAANTLSAILYPEGVDASLPAKIAAHGVQVAGGLHPELKTTYFRIGHMGHVVEHPSLLLRTVDAVEAGLCDAGHRLNTGAGHASAAAILDI